MRRGIWQESRGQRSGKNLPGIRNSVYFLGLFVLFFTELWERFSYYGMRAILVLYLISETSGDNPGMGWSESSAIALYGWYTMFVYLATIPGGILADRFLGQRKSVMVGGLLLCFGHGILAVEALWAFYTGLTFIVLGVGCLKGNISTMVGGLYGKQDINKRDMGFYIFYMGKFYFFLFLKFLNYFHRI